jgi:FAD:protein FMN transferase
MNRYVPSVIWLVVLGGILSLVAVGLWKVQGANPLLFPAKSEPEGIMGTTCVLRAIVTADRISTGEDALDAAEAALRGLEATVSYHLEFSDVSRLNAAEAGQLVEMSPEALTVLAAAREYADDTCGAFDATYAPVFSLWAKSGQAGQLPDAEALEAARQASGWDLYEVHADAVTKLHADGAIDLGGIAKGFGIDRAMEAMVASGVTGGLVDVGGDIRCFGHQTDGKPWRVAIRNPFDDSGETIATLELTDGAVCTSGNYQRFSVIDGVRYSHIIDPRTCQPALLTPSVTVIAPTATAADAWATALSVLGPEGTRMIDPESGIEALLVLGTAEEHELLKTPGFDAYLVSPVPAPSPAGR